MSLHLMECVRPLRLNPSTKLALLAFADSADSATHIAFPGLDAVQEWASVSRSRASAIVAELVDAGLLHHHRPGHRGRRAEYVVFPHGCCPAHPRPLDDDRDAMGPAGDTQSAEKGSCGQDSASVNGARRQDPMSAAGAERVLPTAPFAPKGARLGPAHGHPSLTTTTTPQPPPTPSAGEPTANQPACAAHAPSAAPNCRGCGTTPRALRRAAQIAETLADRDRRLDAQADRANLRSVPNSTTTTGAAQARAALKGSTR